MPSLFERINSKQGVSVLQIIDHHVKSSRKKTLENQQMAFHSTYMKILTILCFFWVFLLLCVLQFGYFYDFRAFMPLITPALYHLNQTVAIVRKISLKGTDEKQRKSMARRRDLGQQLISITKYIALLLYLNNGIFQDYIVMVIFLISFVYHSTVYIKMKVLIDAFTLIRTFLGELLNMCFDCSLLTWILKA